MWEVIVGWIKGLFGAKGTTQIGSRNKSISGITVGDHVGSIVVGDGNTVQVGDPGQKTPSNPSGLDGNVELTAEEKSLLVKLSNSSDGILIRVPNDVGFMFMVEGEQLFDMYDTAARMQYHEAFERLMKAGFLKDVEHNGEVFHLSTEGRKVAGNLSKEH